MFAVAMSAGLMLGAVATASDKSGTTNVERAKSARTAAKNAGAAHTTARPEGCGGPPAARSDTSDVYKREVACRIHARNGAHLYDGAPPPVLRSIVVLSVRINSAGRLVSVRVLRSNGVRQLERRAMQSVRTAMPLPVPAKPVLKQGMIEITETWLFRDDGRFRVRTLASVQAASGY